MRSTSKLYLICIFLCAPFLTKGQWNLADSLMLAGNFSHASLEYERVYFLSESNVIKAESIYRKSLALKGGHKFENALSQLERINLSVATDTFIARIKYEQALLSFLTNDYEACINHVEQANYLVKNKVLGQNSTFLKILSLNELRRWKEGKSALKIYFLEKNIALDADSIYSQLPKLKSKKRLDLYNAFFFGLGQWYVGYPKEAIVSGLLQGGFMFFGVYSVLHGYYFSGLITGAGFLQVFYTGSGRRAEYLLQKKNESISDKFNKPIGALLLKMEAK